MNRFPPSSPDWAFNFDFGEAKRIVEAETRDKQIEELRECLQDFLDEISETCRHDCGSVVYHYCQGCGNQVTEKSFAELTHADDCVFVRAKKLLKQDKNDA